MSQQTVGVAKDLSSAFEDLDRAVTDIAEGNKSIAEMYHKNHESSLYVKDANAKIQNNLNTAVDFSHALYRSSDELVSLADSLKLLLNNCEVDDKDKEGEIDIF